VELDVPPREEKTIFIPLTEAQRFWTYRLLMRMDTAEIEEIFSEGANIKVEDRAIHEGRREVLSMLENQMQQERTLKNGRKYHYQYSKVLVWLTGDTGYKKLMNLLLQLRRLCDQ
jgi:SWI/SNF-related matrix-associated actin-dependent regulator of chromatin subfamily A member 5